MRVVTWNMGKFARRHAEAWRYLRESLRPDIALLQEARPPALLADEAVVFREVYKSWGTGVYVRGAVVQPIETSRYPGRVAAAIVKEQSLHIAVASLHAPIINDRVFPHLDRIFDEIEVALGDGPAIVGGDLNSARLCEIIWPRHGHGPFFERMAKSRFVDCHWRFNGKEVQTFFRKGSVHPLQDDHIFVSSDLASRFTSCAVIDTAAARNLSDHLPIVAEFVL